MSQITEFDEWWSKFFKTAGWLFGGSKELAKVAYEAGRASRNKSVETWHDVTSECEFEGYDLPSMVGAGYAIIHQGERKFIQCGDAGDYRLRKVRVGAITESDGTTRFHHPSNDWAFIVERICEP